MSRRNISESLVIDVFAAHGITCRPVPTQPHMRTPDFVIELATPVVCEVKEISPNEDDLREVQALVESRLSSRWIPNRIRPILKGISPQLRRASEESKQPTLLVIYDATPYRSYSSDSDILQAMFGQLSVDVWIDAAGETRHSDTYFGSKRGLTPSHNTSVSAIGMLRGEPEVSSLSLTLFSNPHARVPLDFNLFDGLPFVHKK